MVWQLHRNASAYKTFSDYYLDTYNVFHPKETASIVAVHAHEPHFKNTMTTGLDDMLDFEYED